MTVKKIVITGASGFIGNSFGEYFSRNGYNVLGLTIDEIKSPKYSVRKITFSSEEIAKIVNDEKPDVIIHAAGSASVGFSLIDPGQDFYNSVIPFQSLLEGVRMSQCKPIIVYPSSAAVYGNPKRLPVKETDPLEPISPYGYHKVMGEKVAEEYSNLFSIPVLIIRLFSVFGPHQKKLLVWELFQKFANDQEVVLDGTGEETRDYLFIDNLTEILLTLLPKLEGNFNILNLASGTSISVKELTYKIKNLMGSEKNVVFKNKVRQGDPMFWQADISYLQKLIGNNITRKFDEALKSCLEKWSTDNK
jgi:UDP-glucose 4-epimerase